MPSTAVNSDTGDFVFAARADPRGSYICPECGNPVSYVQQHTRGDKNTTVRAHFRYRNCNDLGVTVTEPSAGDGGGHNGGGESDKHKRRKLDAMNVALEQFPDAEANLETEIGDNQADAVIEFAESHEEYGKGLAIEYQNKNKGKDRAAVQENYARNEYTTLWLWDDQFDYSGELPEIKLFDGEVYTPWPDAVPTDWKSESWVGNNVLRNVKAATNWYPKTKVLANLPRHWFVPTQAEYWNNDITRLVNWSAKDWFTYHPRWQKRFPDYGGYKEEHYRVQAAVTKTDTTKRVPANIVAHWVKEKPKDYWKRKGWDAAFQDRFGYKAEQYRLQTAISKLDSSIAVPATVLADWVLETPKEYWQRKEWDARFNNDHHPSIPHDSEKRVTATWVNKWLLDEVEDLEDRFYKHWETESKAKSVCPRCHTSMTVNPPQSNEIKREINCENCGYSYFKFTD